MSFTLLRLERGMGILAMKPFAGGVIHNGRIAFSFLGSTPTLYPCQLLIPKKVDEIISLSYRQRNSSIFPEKYRKLMAVLP